MINGLQRRDGGTEGSYVGSAFPGRPCVALLSPPLAAAFLIRFDTTSESSTCLHGKKIL